MTHPTRSLASSPRAAQVCQRVLCVENKMADNVVFPRKLLKRFITLYKEQACLWDRTCPGYKQKQKKDEAISLLTELVQEYDPSATKVHILRKIESVRACVRREYRKVQESRAIAKSSDEIYVPHLWYYDLLSFVFEDYTSTKYKRKPGSPVASPGQNEVANEYEEEPEEENYEQLENYSAEYNVETSILDVDSNKVQYYSEDTKKRCEVDDEYDAIGINVAAKLRTLPQNMRILAEKLINDVLFQAQTQALSSTTVVTTPDPIK